MNIENSVVIVTGGASGLGKKITENLLKNGAMVAVYDINQKLLDEIANYENVFIVQCDLTKEKEIQQAIEKTLKRFSRIDVLVNNAGVLYSEPLINIMSKDKRHS